MSEGLTYIAYIFSALLFILALAGLSKQETAKLGCYSGVAGMAIALLATFTKADGAGAVCKLQPWELQQVSGLQELQKH